MNCFEIIFFSIQCVLSQLIISFAEDSYWLQSHLFFHFCSIHFFRLIFYLCLQFFVVSSTTLWFWVFNSLIIPYNVFWTYSKFFLNSFHIYPLPSRPIFVSLFINPLDYILLDNGWVKLCILWKWGQALFFYRCI